MQQWTSEIWLIAGVSFVIGLLLGYLVLRFTKGSIKKQAETENELKKMKSQLENKNQQIEQLFAESAERLKNIAQEYQKLYQQMAKSSAELLPEQTSHHLFTQPLISQQNNQLTDGNTPPRDYSEGPSGILKAEK